MRLPVARIATAAGIAALAGLGGAAAVLAELDDSPGGFLIGLLMVLGAAVLTFRIGRRRPD